MPVFFYSGAFVPITAASKTGSLDAILSRSPQLSGNFNAVLAKLNNTKTGSFDAVLQTPPTPTTQTKTGSFDAVLGLRTSRLTGALDAILAASLTPSLDRTAYVPVDDRTVYISSE